MPLKKIVLSAFLFVFIFSIQALAGNKQDTLPLPRLMAPGDTAVLDDKGQLEFRWGSEGSSFDHYDFAIYKGTQPYEPYVILAKQFPPNVKSVLIDGSTFTPGESYTWSLRYAGSKRSLKAYSIFKVKA